jgi:hypothetical protein
MNKDDSPDVTYRRKARAHSQKMKYFFVSIKLSSWMIISDLEYEKIGFAANIRNPEYFLI